MSDQAANRGAQGARGAYGKSAGYRSSAPKGSYGKGQGGKGAGKPYGNRSGGHGKPGAGKGSYGQGKGSYKGGYKKSGERDDRARRDDNGGRGSYGGKRGGYGEGSSSRKPYSKDGRKPYKKDFDRQGADRKKPYSKDDRGERKDDRRKDSRDFNAAGKKRYDDKKPYDGKKSYGDKKPYDGKKRDFDKRDDKPRGAKSDRFDAKRGGKQNNAAQKKRYRSKKAFDQQKVATIMGEGTNAYRGELDPRKEERSRIAPGRKTRELREIARDAEREKADAERKEREVLDDETLPFEKRFYKNEASPARLAALDVTRAVRKRNAYAHDLIEQRIDNSDMSAADRAFATLLVLGVVSTQGTLDEIINRGMKKPTDAFEDVRDALRISTYEIIFLGKTPHAALDQGVELVRAVSPSASGLGNAILHRVLEMKPEFPFGDPNHDIDALARVYAFPRWMARKLVEDLGAKEASALMHASNDPAPLFIAVNSLKATDEEVAAVFAEAGAELRPAMAQEVAPAGCFHVSNPRAIADERVHALFDQGKILVADASAQAVAEAVFDGFEPESILEVGAGRGTKTILLQSDANRKLGHQVKLTSLDVHEFKVRLTQERADDYGVELAGAVVGNGTRLENAVGDSTYSTVFIDAPCSGLGTLRRHPEIRWRIRSQHIAELADTGLAMLRSGAHHVAEGGQLVYATCTVTYDENYGVVKRFLEETPEGKNFRLATVFDKPCFSSQLVDGSPDAHFAAKFVRIS